MFFIIYNFLDFHLSYILRHTKGKYRFNMNRLNVGAAVVRNWFSQRDDEALNTKAARSELSYREMRYKTLKNMIGLSFDRPLAHIESTYHLNRSFKNKIHK